MFETLDAHDALHLVVALDESKAQHVLFGAFYTDFTTRLEHQ